MCFVFAFSTRSSMSSIFSHVSGTIVLSGTMRSFSASLNLDSFSSIFRVSVFDSFLTHFTSATILSFLYSVSAMSTSGSRIFTGFSP